MIQVARDGTVWMVAGGTLGTFANGAFHAVSAEEAPPSGIVMNITAAPDTTLWVGTNNGLYRLRGSVWSRFDFTANVIKFVAADGHGQAWISTGEGIERFDGASWSHVDFDNNVITSLVVDGIGRVWAAGRNNPIRKAVPSSDSIVNVRDTGTSVPRRNQPAILTTPRRSTLTTVPASNRSSRMETITIRIFPSRYGKRTSFSSGNGPSTACLSSITFTEQT